MAPIKTERAWFTSTTPSSLLRALKGKRLPRQRRLFAVACCRPFLGEMADAESRRAVAVAERYADGLGNQDERGEAFQAVREVAGHRVQQIAMHSGSMNAADLAAAWSAWRLAYAAQLACASSGVEGASSEILKRAARLGAAHATREKKRHSDLIRDIFGNPFRPLPVVDAAWLAWNDRTIPKLAQAIYDERRFEDLPILADALEDAGCTAADLLAHCRQSGEHMRGCWAVELILGKLDREPTG